MLLLIVRIEISSVAIVSETIIGAASPAPVISASFMMVSLP